ncbi:unnamed protein product [Amoebophrya sp. A120]|nr:unnamed protein product [Amoebophrya sp. A120]|eukprot:GSA120T00022427001.1
MLSEELRARLWTGCHAVRHPTAPALRRPVAPQSLLTSLPARHRRPPGAARAPVCVGWPARSAPAPAQVCSLLKVAAPYPRHLFRSDAELGPASAHGLGRRPAQAGRVAWSFWARGACAASLWPSGSLSIH